MEKDRTILVIDDEPLVLEGITLFLELDGFEVLTARGGRDGVNMARVHQPDAIISNFSMPQLDGLEVFNYVRRDPQTADIPFIFFSAKGATDIREQCLKIGADAFLDKWLEPDELLDTVHRVLEAHDRHEMLDK